MNEEKFSYLDKRINLLERLLCSLAEAVKELAIHIRESKNVQDT